MDLVRKVTACAAFSWLRSRFKKILERVEAIHHPSRWIWCWLHVGSGPMLHQQWRTCLTEVAAAMGRVIKTGGGLTWPV